MVRGEEAPGQSQAHDRCRRGDRPEHEIHHRGLDPDRVGRLDPGEDQPDHGTGKKDDADRLGGLDLRDEGGSKGGPDMWSEGVRGRQSQRQLQPR